jgi:methylmalonyl-CoA mutase N-terminal domain/subunit
MRGQARLEAVTIAAAYAYMSGDSVRAGIAVDIATTEAEQAGLEEPMLAVLLNTALRRGVEPKKIREIILAAAATAAGDNPES